MKDIPNHMTKFMKKVLKEQEELEIPENLKKVYEKPKSKIQLKKQAKIKMRKSRQNRTPVHKTIEEDNKALKHKNPVFPERYPRVPY